MKGIAIFGLLLIASTIIFLSIFAVWVGKMPEPKLGRDCLDSDWLWDSSCMYITETGPDNFLESPKDLSPVLVGFQNSSGAGPSIFLPCWYRFRYVNVKTGGYSDFSEWSKAPVMSGSCCLPCPKGVGQCPSGISVGYNSCTFNQPTIGIAQTDVHYDPTQVQSDGSFIYMNLHRYVGSSPSDMDPPPIDVQDEIVGYLLPTVFLDGVQYYSWIDMYNPCKNGCTTPTWCESQGTCNQDYCIN
jgi:hypothetical protein